jgi:hypothetical protein
MLDLTSPVLLQPAFTETVDQLWLIDGGLDVFRHADTSGVGTSRPTGRRRRRGSIPILPSFSMPSWCYSDNVSGECFGFVGERQVMRAGWAQLETVAAGFAVVTTLQAKSNVRIP